MDASIHQVKYAKRNVENNKEGNFNLTLYLDRFLGVSFTKISELSATVAFSLEWATSPGKYFNS